MRELLIRPEAEADVQEAWRWYHTRSPLTATRFLDTLEALLQVVQEQPQSFRTVRGALHRALLPRFPFAVYFDVEADRIRVVAVLHVRRRPRRWRR